MPYDLFPEVEREATARASGSMGVGDTGTWTGFARGTGMYAMRSMAETARAIDMAGAVVPIALDKLTGGTVRQDQYFAEHDDVFNRAVDHWTPKPGEVGAAGQIVGSLAGSLPLVIANPAAAVGSAQLSSAEDLARQGVSPTVANLVGAVQGAGLAVGLRLPFIGGSLTSRVASGAAGNVAVGAAGAGAAHALLDAAGNPTQAEQFNPWDMTQRSLDLLMGAAFGGLAHLSAREQMAREAAMPQQAKDAILTLNQAKHLEDVATPGKATPEDLTRGVQAVKAATDQLLRGEPVNVEQITQGMRVAADPARDALMAEAAVEAGKQAKMILNDVVLRNQQLMAAQETPGFQRTPEQLVALRRGQPVPEGAPELQRAIEIANKPGFLRTADEKITLENALAGNSFDHLLTPIQRDSVLESRAQAAKLVDLDARLGDLTANRDQTISDTAKDLRAQGIKSKDAKRQAAEMYESRVAELKAQRDAANKPPPMPSAEGAPQGEASAGQPPDPLVDSAQRIAQERPDILIPTGDVDANGNAVTMSAADYMAQAADTAKQTKTDAGLFRTAITCLLGVL